MSRFRQGLKTLLTTVLPRHRMLDRGTSNCRQIALTFDDGPHPKYTPRLLDQLARYQIRATFFVVGQQAARYPELVERIYREGHVIGNHSYTHREPSQIDAQQLAAEIRQTRDLIEHLIGFRCTLFRPPKGHLTWAKMRAIWRLDQTIVLWNQDPRDYLATSELGISEWTGRYQPRNGDIVLMHDTHAHCIPAIEEFLRVTRRQALEFATPDQWLMPGQWSSPVVAAAGPVPTPDVETVGQKGW